MTLDARFDPERFCAMPWRSHTSLLGIAYHAHGPDWAELALPFDPDQVGDVDRGVVASGPIISLMDMASSISIWIRLGYLRDHATLDLRVDYLRPATPGMTIIGRAECYRITRSIAFVRGQAHDGDAANPLAHVAGTFMAPEGYR